MPHPHGVGRELTIGQQGQPRPVRQHRVHVVRMDQGMHGERAVQQGIVRGVAEQISRIVLEVEGAPPRQIEDIDHAAAEHGEMIEHGRAAARRGGVGLAAQLQDGRGLAGGSRAGPDPESPADGLSGRAPPDHHGLDCFVGADRTVDRAMQDEGGFGEEHVPQQPVLDLRADESELVEEAFADRGETGSLGSPQNHGNWSL